MNEKKICNPELLTLYHYQELDDAELHQFEDHLSQCEECRTELQMIEAGLAKIPEMELEIGVMEKQQFCTQVLNKTTRRSWKKPLWGGALAAASALMLALIIMPGMETQQNEGNQVLADLEMLDQLDLLQDFELLQDLELLVELEDLR